PSRPLRTTELAPARHGISNPFSLYVRNPDGHRLELYTSDYFTGDHDHEPLRWSLKDPRRQTLWGSPAPRSWFEEGSPFTGQAVREPRFVAGGTGAGFAENFYKQPSPLDRNPFKQDVTR